MSEDEDTNNKVALMTAHSSKGLEFPYVFVAGMEENLFPSASMLAAKQEVEEERRLFYVAMTRAKKAVRLSFAGTRMRNGKHESNAPSRFLKEIDARFIENPLEEEDFDNSGVTHEWGGFGSRFTGGRLNRFGAGNGAYGQSSGVQYERKDTGRNRFGQQPSAGVATHGCVNGRGPQPQAVGRMRPQAEPARGLAGQPSASVRQVMADANFVGVPMTELREGQRIEHNRFGLGTILELSGRAPEMKAKIRFDAHGEKLLLLKYAKIRPVD